jgi:tetratricopeptide (TPR) repeat protein
MKDFGHILLGGNLSNSVEQLLNAAEIKLHEDQFQIAVNLCQQALKHGNSSKAKFILKCCFSKLGRHDDAIELAKELAIDTKGINNLALTYVEAGEIKKATKEYRKAIQRRDCDPAIHSNYILHLKKIGETDECLGYLKYIIREIPHSDSLWYTRGVIFNSLNDFNIAKESFLKSLQIRYSPLVEYDLSLAYFISGDYENGWKHYESRWKACWLFERMRSEVPGKFWQGESLEDKSILLWCEQGIGDLIQFYRYVKILENQGAKVSVKYDDSIFPHKAKNFLPYKVRHLWNNSTGFGPNVADEYDFNCSILTVAGMLNADVKNTCGKSYLKSTLPILPNDEKRKIGLCWCGNSGHPRDKERSIKLKEFHLNKNDNIYSLVKNYSPKPYEDGSVVDWSEGYQNSVIDMSSYLKDLNHTAQVIEWLDIVVTVDTVIAHLAGALGKKTYLLLPYNCDWRWWNEKEETTPWYDSITLIRQKTPGNWDSEIKLAKEKLWT